MLIDKTKPVAIVESEKTAIIGSIVLDQYTWVATGGKTSSVFNKLQVLKEKKVILLPDLDAVKDWEHIASKLKGFASVQVNNYLLTIATKEVYELFPILFERRNEPAGSLSGGERQMLAISRALVSRPKLLLLDEPSLGLAPLIAAQIISIINELCRSTGLTVLLVEQNANTALAVADHGILLALGKVVADLPAKEMAADSSLRAAYLGY